MDSDIKIILVTLLERVRAAFMLLIVDEHWMAQASNCMTNSWNHSGFANCWDAHHQADSSSALFIATFDHVVNVTPELIPLLFDHIVSHLSFIQSKQICSKQSNSTFRVTSSAHQEISFPGQSTICAKYLKKLTNVCIIVTGWFPRTAYT